MKNFLILVIFVIATVTVSAQTEDSLSVNTKHENSLDSTKFFKEITIGVIRGVYSTTSVGVWNNIFVNATFVTAKTFHTVMYGTGDNSITSLNGVFLNEKWDVYFLVSHSLKYKKDYLAIGGERLYSVITEKKYKLNFFLLAEVGTNFAKGGPGCTTGILMSFQRRINR